MKRILPIIMIFMMLLSGCGGTVSGGQEGIGSTTGDSETAGSEENSAVVMDFSQNASDMFTNRDYEIGYDESTSVLIQLNGDSISCSSNAVQISGTTAVITDEGTYILSGELDDGMIVVNAGDNDKPQIVLNGASINSETSAPLYILNADKVFLTLAADTSNVLSNGGTFVAVDENNIDAAIFSKEDLTINGTGSLTVVSPAGHGIVSKDDLVFTSGTYIVQSASHGLDANDSVRIANASVSIEAGKDGIHVENSDDETLGFVYIASGTLEISAEGDGISAGAYMQIEGGTFDIVTGGGSVNAAKQSSDFWGGFRGEAPGGDFGGGAPGGNFRGGASGGRPSGEWETSADTDDSSTSIKAIKASGDILINGGTFTIDAADDAIHSNSSITVNGGTFEIASGDDGFHADEALTITDGTIHITESYEGLEALNLEISGGDITLVASDDGLNAAGGTDSSGFEGQRGNDRFGGMGPGGQSTSSNGTIVISGGNLYIKASGDGIDANGTLLISGGNTTVVGPTQGDTATLDYDVSGTITGGTFIGTGASGMAQTFSSSEQGVIAVSVGNQSAGTQVVLKDSAGNTILSCEPELPFAVVILSSPELIKGEIYTLSVGTSSEEFTAS